MAGEFTITAVNDWRAGVHVDLSRALRVSMDVWRRDGLQATKHMLILMAQSAAAMTPSAKRNRTVMHDARLNGAKYVEVYNGGKGPTRVHQFRFSSLLKGKDRLEGTWENAKKVGYAGLARRSWMWGLSSIAGDVPGYKGRGSYKPMRGVARSYTLNQGKVVGHVLENRLSYLMKIIPPNYARIAESNAVSKLLKQAEMKMVRTFEQSIGRRAA